MGTTNLTAARQIWSWTRWAAVIGSFIVLLASARDAAALCQNGLTTQTVASPAGNNLYDAMRLSTAPCTLSVGAGTYRAPTGLSLQFSLPNGITVKSISGAAVTTLIVDSFTAVAIWPLNGTCPSGATLDGFTLEAPAGGVFVGADPVNHPGCASNQITGVTLRNLFVSPTTTPTGGHGLEFHGVQSSVIDSCTIFNAFANGILLDGGSNNNIVMNSAVLKTATQHAIAVQDSNDNVIVGNVITGSAFDGILLNSSIGLAGPGSSRNRIERNAISGHLADGITLTQASLFNYLGLNTAVSSSYNPVTKPTPSPIFGVGLWINDASNGNYLFGNDVSGSPENGIDVLTSRSTYLQANTVHGNLGGGIWVANIHDNTIDPAAPPPQDTVLHGNRVFFNTSNGQMFFQDAIHGDAAYNYLSAAQSGVLAGVSTTAFLLKDSDSIGVYENTVSEVGSRAFVYGATTNARFFRNRFLKGTNIPSPPQTDGRNGVTYSVLPADVRWDAGSFLGGNNWSEYTAATGSPDLSHPYKAFIGNTGGGPYVDRFPYASEALQTSSLPNSVAVVEPVAGSVLAATTTKTIRWVARGCVLVDISYSSGVLGATSIVSGYPNVGFYFWSVPSSVPLRPDYSVQVVCKDSNGNSLAVSGNSPSFTIASNDLVLLNPGRGTRAVGGGTVRVAWKATTNVSGVDIFVKAGSGAETQVASNVMGTTFQDIVLPAAVSSRVTVRIQDPRSATRQDSVDGYFMTRGASPSFTTNLAGQALQIGSIQLLEWAGVSGSYTVDLDLVGQTFTSSIAKNLPDFGNFTWLVPDTSLTTATVRVTFKDASGTAIATVNSGTFSALRNAGAPPPTPTNTAGALHDLNGDKKTDITVFRPSSGTWYVRYSGLGYSTADAFQWGLPGDIAVSGDFDGDGKADLTVFRPSNGTWYIRYSSLGYSAANAGVFQWGLPGDIPIVGDFDGDGKTELTVFRPSNGTWYVRYSSLGYSTLSADAFQWGLPGDVPIAGDVDGDGKTELTVFRPSTGTWFVRYSSLGYGIATAGAFQWGLPGDLPVASDFDGDGKADLAVFRPSLGGWFILYSARAYTTANYDYFQWGLPGDVPIAADFDGDGQADLTVFRPSTGEWFIRFSSVGYSVSSYAYYQWGLPGDALVK